MIEADILKLNERSGRPLDRLEADIWAGVDARITSERISKVVLSCQAAVLTLALLSSIAVGTRTAMADNRSMGLDVFSTWADLAPSTRLIGH